MSDMTQLAVQKLPAAATYKKYNVSPGLFVGVAASGEKTFIVRYSVNKKQVDYRLPHPFGVKSDAGHISLADARTKAAEIKALGKQGINYEQKLASDALAVASQSAKQGAEDFTVQSLYDAWFPTTKRKDDGAELTRSFKRDVLPILGAIKLRDIEEGHIRKLLEPISAAGTNRKAVVILNNLKQMFKWANGRKPWKLLVDDPTINLKADDITQRDYEEVERERTLAEG